MKKVTLMVFSYVIWFLLVWPFDPVTKALDVQSVVAGVVVAVLVGLLFGDHHPLRAHPGNPLRRLFWFLAYVPMFAWYVILANFDVVYRVIHPALPIRPGIVKIKTSLTSPEGRTMLANSITLTPGTITVDISEDGHLYIHWIYVRAEDVETATQHISARFERVIRRIFA